MTGQKQADGAPYEEWLSELLTAMGVKIFTWNLCYVAKAHADDQTNNIYAHA